MRNQKGFAQFIIILTGALVIILSIVFFAIKNEQIKINPQLNPSEVIVPSITTPPPYETSKNGVYTNNKYRLRFEYPEEIFITFINNAPRPDYANKLEAEFIDKETDGYPDKYNMIL